MHEMSIAQNLLEIVQEHVEQLHWNHARVKTIRMRIGEMAGVVPESLRFCFEVASEGTVAQGAELAIEEMPTLCHCPKCGCHFRVESFAFICPSCQSIEVRLISGNELDVVELEMVE